MKKFLIIILGAIVLLTGTVSSFADSDIIAKDEQNEMDFQTISIYKDVDDAIMSVESKTDRDKIYNYWYTTAYIQILDESDEKSFNEIGCTDEKAALEIINSLVSLSGTELDNEIAKRLNRGTERILKMNDILIPDEYLNYVAEYIPTEKVDALKSKSELLKTVESGIMDSKNGSVDLNATTKTYSANMYKNYGNSDSFSKCKFGAKVTWTVSNGKIKSIKKSNVVMKKPSHISVTALQRNKVFCNSAKTAGYMQLGWGYVNFYYGGKGLMGYYLIDGKVWPGGKSKYKGATVTPDMWSRYKWGNL